MANGFTQIPESTRFLWFRYVGSKKPLHKLSPYLALSFQGDDVNNAINPIFQWNEFFWEAVVNLPDSVGFQERNGPYGAMLSDERSSGE